MSEPSNEPPSLMLLAEKLLSRPVKADLLAYCPTMDLLALATSEERVYVYRLNGQRVIGSGNKNQRLEVRKIQWKPNGQLLAVGWSDNAVRLISPENSKIIHKIHASPDQERRVTFLAWAMNFTDEVASKARVGASHGDLDAMLKRTVQTHAPEALPDLPKTLALLDIEGTLPKLSPLPSGKDEDVFSSRATLDAMFHPLQLSEGEAVDVLFVGLDDGKVHLSIYNRFEIGTFDIGRVSGRLTGCRPVLHAAHTYSSTHALLVTQQGCTFFLTVDLRFLSSAGEYLPLLAAKSTQLQNLLRYIRQVQRIIQAEWKACQDLPGKFIYLIESTLNEKQQCSFVHAAYQLVVTGSCSPVLKEWLVDTLSERGHKRWEKAVMSGYETIRRLAHENLLPALERCAVVAVRLRGLSKFHTSDSALGLSLRDLNGVVDGISCLSLLAHNILKYAGSELRQFIAFSNWLRHEIDIHAADPTSTADDPAEKETDIDYAKVLDYIQGPMMNSRVAKLVSTPSARTSATPDEGSPLYGRLQEDLKKMDSGVVTDQELLGLCEINSSLDHHCSVVFQRVAESQKRNVLFGNPIRLTSNDTQLAGDMRMLFEDDYSVTYVAIRNRQSPQKLGVVRVALRIVNGLSSTEAVEMGLLELEDGEIRDVKFADDEYLMVLWGAADASRILRVPYPAASPRPGGLTYRAWAPLSADDIGDGLFASASTITLSHEQASSSTYARHTFPANSFPPAQMEINGRRGRQVICVLSHDGLRYQIFDLGGDPTETSRSQGPDEDDDADASPARKTSKVLPRG